MDGSERFIEVPVWFLKLCGAIFSIGTGFVILWGSWVTMTMLDIRSEIGTAAELKARVNLLEKEVVENKLAIARATK